eukprot:scaffold235282_cov24-Tisochrysis_lutea.AAC.1
MVREYAGAPGVSAERVAEGMDIRHCALSLVGIDMRITTIAITLAVLHYEQGGRRQQALRTLPGGYCRGNNSSSSNKRGRLWLHYALS